LGVDKSPRDDTRQAVLSSPEWSLWYAIDIDKSPHPDIIRVMKGYLLSGDKYAVQFFKEFGNEL